MCMRVCKRERKTQQTREQKIVCERESKNDSEGETASERQKQGCTLAFFRRAAVEDLKCVCVCACVCVCVEISAYVCVKKSVYARESRCVCKEVCTCACI